MEIFWDYKKLGKGLEDMLRAWFSLFLFNLKLEDILKELLETLLTFAKFRFT